MLCAFSFLFSWSPLLNDQVLGPPPRIRPPLQQPPMRYGVVMVWHCVVWYCIAWYDMLSQGMVWYGTSPPPSPSLRPDAEISRIQLCRLHCRGFFSKCKTFLKMFANIKYNFMI